MSRPSTPELVRGWTVLMDSQTLLNLTLVLLFVLVGGVFAATEIALVSLRESQLTAMERSGARGARVAEVARNPNRFLAAVQIGVTVAGFFSAAYGGSTLAPDLAPYLERLGLGEDGQVVLYQNELPYDPPTQADWDRPDGTRGWAGYKVADDVRRHELYGGGVYVFNRNDPSIVTERGFEVPTGEGIRLHHLLTVNLDAGAIEHVVNDVGARVDSSAPGVPSYVVDYPAR